MSQKDNGCSRVNMRSKSNTKQTQFLLTLNTKMVCLASWPLAVAIGYGALAEARLNSIIVFLARMNCLGGKMDNALYWLDEIPNCT